MLLPALFSAIALIGTPVGSTSPYDMDIYVRDKARETVFMASPGMADAGALPVFRICYRSAASTPAPDALNVHIGTRTQRLTQGRCSFFAGDQIDLALGNGEGTVRASITLLR
ncbi:MAG: hypothetical protein CVT79_05265 [Alphaproteobacteria bacterium HGW-Alphaproteobacteria-18]|nr:MAG: hypothetical protein CVT79_05265 [Alphaproteobacteria bacterium HGW-Alphaproteobacteria-18]